MVPFLIVSSVLLIFFLTAFGVDAIFFPLPFWYAALTAVLLC